MSAVAAGHRRGGRPPCVHGSCTILRGASLANAKWSSVDVEPRRAGQPCDASLVANRPGVHARAPAVARPRLADRGVRDAARRPRLRRRGRRPRGRADGGPQRERRRRRGRDRREARRHDRHGALAQDDRRVGCRQRPLPRPRRLRNHLRRHGPGHRDGDQGRPADHGVRGGWHVAVVGDPRRRAGARGRRPRGCARRRRRRRRRGAVDAAPADHHPIRRDEAQGKRRHAAVEHRARRGHGERPRGRDAGVRHLRGR